MYNFAIRHLRSLMAFTEKRPDAEPTIVADG